jgi:hypothetical protein
MSAVLLTLIFLLFPPTWQSENPIPKMVVSEQAEYRTTPEIPTGVSSIPPSGAAQNQIAATVKDSHAAATSTSNTTHPLHNQSLPPANSNQPKTAEIALATPHDANTQPDTSGVDSALMGRTYSGSVSVIGFKLPLPPGNWVVLANSSINTPTASGTAYFIGRIEHKRLVGALRVFAAKSKDKPGAGFIALKGCAKDNPNAHYIFIESVTPFDHEACWFIEQYYTPALQKWADRTTQVSGLDRAAAGDMAAKGVTYPQDFVLVRFGRAEKWGLVQADYLFSPESEGVSSNVALSYYEMDWHPKNIARFPEKQAYVAKLKEWGTSFWPKFQTAFAEGE